MGRGTISRELNRLVSAGMLLVRYEGNQHYYSANPDCPVYDELVNIVRKAFGIADVIREALMPVYEQIDLLVVSDSLAYTDLMTVLVGGESSLARPIIRSIYTVAEHEGHFEITPQLLNELIKVTKELLSLVEGLGAVNWDVK